MSLPPLLKHVYNYGTNEVITRGKKIFYTQGVSLLDVDPHIEQVRFRVRNDIYNSFYTVTVAKFLQPDNLTVRCQCPYNLSEICRHEVAALFQLNDLMQSGFFENTNISYNQKHTVVRMRVISSQMIRMFTSAEILENATGAAARNEAVITYSKNERVEADVSYEDTRYKVTLAQNEDRYFDTSCGCEESIYPICIHKAILFLQILKKYGPQYFKTLQNWDDQKNKLLRQYGYNLNDDLSGKFDFIYENGKPFLRILDASIKKITEPVAPIPKLVPEQAIAEADPKHLGIVLDTQTDLYPYVTIELISGETDEADTKFIGPIEKLDLNKYINPEAFYESEKELVTIARKFAPEEIIKYLRKNLPFGDFLGEYQSVLKDDIQEDIHRPLWEYLLPKYKKLLQRNENNPFCFIRLPNKSFTSASLTPVSFESIPAIPILSVSKNPGNILIELQWNINGETIKHQKIKPLNAALLMLNKQIYYVNNIDELQITEQFPPDGKMEIAYENWNDFLKDNLMKWRKHIVIDFTSELIENTTAVLPRYRLYLQERTNMLTFRPVFVYNDVEADTTTSGSIIQARDGMVTILERNTDAEHAFTHLLEELHANMIYSNRDHHYFLPSKDVLAKNWFFQFSDVMKEWNVELYGYSNLKTLRINENKPETRVQVSSGIDWFDTSIQIVYGDLAVSIADVKKALAQKENYIKLSDGSIGLLPESLVQKFSLLTKMGEVKDNKLRIKKIHFSILDELLADVDETAVQKELEEKKEQLNRIIDNDYSKIQAPENLKATLRPYQQAGFQWLMFLKEAGWGGILADDMGLGKTVQTLAFLAHYKNENPTAKFLVVCPTTLMYNWESEINKFTPDFKQLIHHGSKRGSTTAAFEAFDVIITSYGTIRSDIKMLTEYTFDYVVLDESQAIKNPKSLATKAAMLLNAKHKIALSGTPIQNNTFDLYAQMNFLNPGILGGREFFMNEFATPIDKFQEDEVKHQLKKLIYPFLLRRTKNQVAKDLPEKTETVLHCEMGKEQRKIYDAYRNNYKAKILGMIDEQGIERSHLHILQGLTKLRQICDSPAILNEQDKLANHSIKLDELTREIEENVGDHKALIFSQFLGMLALIRDNLKEKGIPYVYFDGGSSAMERERAIKEFQNNDECRVFLISLKAGGIGLNLTAADYVYIVDPWWNPAVEQQAIDRTHRIGQTKNIFAYRFICKDTIEEKMMILQDRKRALADDLIADDNAILKRLTRDDIAFLLS